MPDASSLSVASALDDRYVIQREIGAGGMAVVYLATDRKLDRDVALKVLRPELGAVLGAERFLAEIRISAKLDHPHILTLIDSGDANGFLYYVLPYVRGESLRDRLERERQLPVDESLAITKQVASALDYAHRQGLVHRDIKPENILLQEGEAMLTDFGIALAVKQAGGNRLTQSGLSLGTPQYMSPEQATGDRNIDARSDLYSLAAVLYEMLAGEPPVTGASAQSIIAKLMTEKPTRLRVVRDGVPLEVDEAVARALSKSPADRFRTAGEFIHALETRHAGGIASASTRRRNALLVGAGLAVAVAAIGFAKRSGRIGGSSGHATLGHRTQLTTSGNVRLPVISPDGKQLAYVARQCDSTCAFSLVVQDVGGTATRALLSGMSAAYGVSWSPDRRNLIFDGTIGGRSGAWLVSAIGGTATYINNIGASFYAGGDSLVIAPAFGADSVFWIKFAGLDGVPRDSIAVHSPGQRLIGFWAVPGTNFFFIGIARRPSSLWQLIDRHGKVMDKLDNSCACVGKATSDAVWLQRVGARVGDLSAIVRVGIDRDRGGFEATQDTMVRAAFTEFSLTDDGASLVMDEGTSDFSTWAVPLSDALKGRLTEQARIAHASTFVHGLLSPDGNRVLMSRRVPTGPATEEVRYSTVPFGGGSEIPLDRNGVLLDPKWNDSTTILASSRGPRGTRLQQIDVRTGTALSAFETGDSIIADFALLRDGWAWIPRSRDRVIIDSGGERREVRIPGLDGIVGEVEPDNDRRRIFLGGYSKTDTDSIRIIAYSLDDGRFTNWVTAAVEKISTYIDGKGGLNLAVGEAQERMAVYVVPGPRQVTRIGTIPRPVGAITFSRDLRRAVVSARDYRADVWLSQVITH